MLNIWPFNKPKDELAPETSVKEAEENVKRMEPDAKDGLHVSRATLGGKKS